VARSAGDDVGANVVHTHSLNTELDMRAPALIALVTAVACRGIDTPGPMTLPTPFVVSTPHPDAKLGANRGEIVWVALPAQTIVNADEVTIRVASTGETVSVKAVNGGLDPVPVSAALGDQLQLTVTKDIGADIASYGIAIAGSKGPVVIRTSPPPKKRDVPLNTVIVIVFSEPISPESLERGAVSLTSSGTPISGTLAFADSAHLTMSFTPDAPLAPATDYTMTITQGVTNVDGQSLRQSMVVPFTTTDPSVGLQKYEVTGAVTDDAGTPLAGALLYFSYLQSYAPGWTYSQMHVQTDGAGRFVADIPGLPGSMKGPPGTEDAMAFLDFASAGESYDSDSRYILASAMSDLRVHLTRRREIASGDSMSVFVAPDNSICVNNTQDMHPWPTEWVCATIHVMPSSDGQLTITATPTDGATLPGLEAEPEDWSTQYFSLYPTTGTLTFPVTHGVPQRLMVEIPWGSSGANFMVKTTLVPP